ncbi:MAG: glycosyltransferase family 39 protein [Solirubrobacteraceae bacterium]
MTASPPTPAAPRGALPTPRRFGRTASVLVCVLMTAPIGIYLWVALHRVGYGFELDWMEGGSVELAARVLAGHSLYAAPSLRFVGWTYPPLYYWVSAGVAELTGIGFLPLRLVSLAASLVSMAALAWIVVRDTGDRIAGLIAAGLFAATFRISGAWFDTGRVDSLFLAITLIALAWGRTATRTRQGIVLGVLAFLAFFTKQSALVALAPALGLLAVTRRRVGIPASATLLALLVVSTLALDASTDGWYRYYVFSELSGQPWATQVWVSFWRSDILAHQWPLVLLMAAGAISVARATGARRALRSPWTYHLAAAAGLIASAWLSRLHTGGYENVLMPAYAAVALLAGLACARLAVALPPRVGPAVLGSTLLVQLALLAYPIAAQIPTAADRASGAQLIDALRALPGPVVVLRHPWYATVAGKGTFAQEEAIGDVLRSGATRGARALRASLARALDADRIAAVVLDGTFDAHFLGSELRREFRLAPQPITPTRLYPLTDVRSSPTLLYLRVRRPAR